MKIPAMCNGIKLIDEVIKDMDKRSEINTFEEYVNGEAYEKWLYDKEMYKIAYGVEKLGDEKVVFSFSTKGMHKPITNGDVIRAMFPNMDFYDPKFPSVKITISDENGHRFGNLDSDWWNAPYSTESVAED